MDFHGFYTGQIFDAYEWMGAHYTEKETTFRTFAPQAKNVELLLAGKMIPMKKKYPKGIIIISLWIVPESSI